MKRIPAILSILLAACFCAFAQTPETTCPEITAVAPSGLTVAGDTMTFTANITNFSGPGEIKYEWHVSAGTIEKGQSTSSIEVRTTQDMASSNVTAVITIEGIPGGCVREASETAQIAPRIGCGMPTDDFGRLSKGDTRARIDNFIISIQNDPQWQGFVDIRLNERESRVLKLSFLNNIYDAMLFRKFDPSRVIFAIERGSFDTQARLWVVAPGATLPLMSKESILIKGTEFKQKINDLFKTNK